MITLNNVKKDVNKLREENEDLRKLNSSISLRASIGFENLTPRPDFK